ncbi:LysR family transcriptional regulator [Bowmanella yangjiangensis]|uniref:LysR family transcriptional regulator n=1 Tax=Bowmanella yangjiangensis TaxID=2811230 RepID=A0ABS3CU17_9ALTE|nr:LysR family transcriptional regulator [Bowmanella yangjiangensis]MBN7820110.1 LysR family transcriptional regulator [Bowmanella yangjiangensis]
MSDYPSLNSLRVFDAAARLQSFKLAADELHLTPTAVSHQIRNLEAWLGLQLFSRHVRQVRLTAPGEQLAQVTYASLQAIGQVLSELKQQSQGLVISCTSSFAALWLLPRMAELQALLPDTQMEIRSGELLEPLQSVSSLGIRFGPIADQNHRLSHEYFNLYGTAEQLAAFDARLGCRIFIPKWKNASLPAAPWDAYRQQTPMRWNNCGLEYFDQELFAVQQAQAGLGLVFSGQTLVKNATSLRPVPSYSAVPSGLGYYVQHTDNRKLTKLISWLTLSLTSPIYE